MHLEASASAVRIAAGNGVKAQKIGLKKQA